METARSHSVTMQTGAPDEAENPGRADSARPGRRHQPRGDWAGDGIVVLSSPQPFVGFSGVTAVSCGETQLFIPSRCRANRPGIWGSTEYDSLYIKRGLR